MTNQRKIEILKQMLEILDKRIKSFYLCAIISELYSYDLLSENEYYLFKGWFKSRKPTSELYLDIYKHHTYKPFNGLNEGWWDSLERLERKHFLETLINELKEEIA